MNRVELIRERLDRVLTPEKLDISDDSHLHAGHAGAKESGGGHFTVRIVSDAFRNLSMVERHRLVYDAVNDLMPAEIHALSIHAHLPEEPDEHARMENCE